MSPGVIVPFPDVLMRTFAIGGGRFKSWSFDGFTDSQVEPNLELQETPRFVSPTHIERHSLCIP
jgi:hypothetical protein